jgi:cytochrome c biogenesis protein
MQKEKKSFIDILWDMFASVKLAIVLFALISLSSIIGTVIEQNAPAEKNLIVLKRIVGEDAAPTVYRILDSLGFMDMYHSWWFVAFLVLFSVNLIICSLDRLPRILNLVREPIRPLDTEKKNFPIKKEIKIKKSPEELREPLLKMVRSIGFKADNSPLEQGGYQLYAQNGNWTRLGVYITHLSVLVIMIGAVIGIFLGFKGFLNLREGEASNVAYTRDGRPHELGFSIRCDDFDVEFYGMSEMPKDYRSWLTVIKDGKEVMRKVIEVNEPLKFEGYTFYQSSYGMVPNAHGIFIFKVTGPGGKTETILKRFGESFTIPGTEIVGKIKDFSPALAFDRNGRPYTYTDMMNNPAVYIEFTEKDKRKYAGWVLRRFPKTWYLPDGNIVEFIDYWGVQYTGLQVRKDPGVWMVYLGCIIMTVGLYVAFFMSHRRIWVFVRKDGKQSSSITVLATSNKNRGAFERKIESMISKIKSLG